ncbi:MAG: hypothetical protein HY248_01845, partial [Fimbriimonas ginsengisoli]|nr:hypothetical protein [Fimbriimonas ginsengisoli]
FLRWIQECLVATTTGPDHPQPVGVVNDPSIAASAHDIRWSTNNYYSNHARHIGLLSMALDAADDVPAAASDPAAGTLRRYVGNAIGAWLYVHSKYEAGDGAGGIEPEGFGYGEDLTYRAWAFLLLAMQTTGTDNPQIYGPQASAATSVFWQQSVPEAYLHMLSPGQTVQQNWIGPAYLMYSFGDLGLYTMPDTVRTFGALAMYAVNTGNTAQYAKLRWMIDNLPPGGLPARDYRIHGEYSGIGSWEPAIFYFLATDPSAAGVDPRPSEPKDYFASGLGIVLSRTGWTQSDSWMTYKLSWNAIDHQHADGNAIGFYRNGEWLTMPEAGYGVNIGSSDYQNTLAIQNPGNTNNAFWQPNISRGSQYIYDPAADPPPPLHSATPIYTYVQGDSTNLYNNPSISATDVQHASRSALWLKPGVMAIYDRATTGMSGRFKRFHLNTPALATVNGKSASVTTPGGQFFSVDALLPANATLTAVPRETFSDYAEQAVGDPMGFRLWSEDLNLPADVRFLNVLQGAGSAAQKQPVSLLQSSAGTPMDGALVGTTAVMF